MTKLAKPRKSNRLNVSVTDKGRNRMEKLQSQLEAESLSDVIRKGVALLQLVVDARMRNEKVFVRNENGDERELWVLD